MADFLDEPAPSPLPCDFREFPPLLVRAGWWVRQVAGG